MHELLSTNAKVYVAACGAGIVLIRELWATPGASAYFVGATMPYAKEEADRFLGYTPEQYVSPETAIDLSIAAFLRAARYGESPIGVGITASIAGKEVHLGDHRGEIHVIARRPKDVSLFVPLEKRSGLTARMIDDWEISLRAQDLIRHAARLPMIDVELEAQLAETDARVEWKGLSERPVFCADGRREKDIDPKKVALFPGAFNPIHVGHMSMAAEVERQTGKKVVFELLATTPHKEPVSAAELLYRIAHINKAGFDAILTEGIPLYIDKARRWPGIDFCIGADAAMRMLDPKWGPEVDSMLREFECFGSRFYVFERNGVDGLKSTSSRVPLVFQWLKGSWPVSSSELRAANAT